MRETDFLPLLVASRQPGEEPAIPFAPRVTAHKAPALVKILIGFSRVREELTANKVSQPNFFYIQVTFFTFVDQPMIGYCTLDCS